MLQTLDKEQADDLSALIDNVIQDEFASGFFWGYCEGNKETKTIAVVVKEWSYLDETQKSDILSIIEPYYEEYDLEQSLLNNF